MTDPVLADLRPDEVRVRFCPSPTGDPHVGLIRTALFNWAFARHYGGTLVFRIEDTDAARDSQESYDALLSTLTWLGLDWDEGPEVGGGYGPYRQSERTDIYRDVLARLREAGLVYESYSTPEEVAERRRAKGEDPKRGYDNADRELSDEQRRRFRAEGRSPVLRMRMPDRETVFEDLVRGTIRVGPDAVADFAVARSNGDPLYTLVNPVDDVLMGITHVLRGEDLLSSTPRQLAVYDALAQIGVGDGAPRRFGHLPFVMGEGNRKLSKRDPASSMSRYREAGFLPEGLLNYLALLGWSIAEDRDVFSLQEMVQAFDIRRVNPNPARFDLKKCEAINGQWVRRLDATEFADRLVAYLAEQGRLSGSEAATELVRAAAPLVQERTQVLADAAEMLDFLLVSADEFAVDPAAANVLTGERAASVLASGRASLAALTTWSTRDIEAALREALIDGLGLKPRHAFAPIRVAATGRKVSPPLFESLELLGRAESLRRLQSAEETAAADAAGRGAE